MKNLYFNSIVKKLKQLVVLFAILFGFSTTINAQAKKVFTQRTSQFSPTKKIYNVKGDFTMFGNTCLTPQNYSATQNNNNQSMVYVDTDGDSSTFNSSSSTLEIASENGSVPSCSTIVFAGLYWTGAGSPNQTFNVTKNSVTKTFNKRVVKLKGPTASSYTDITAAAGDIYYPSGTEDNIYAAYAEVTDYVRQNGIGKYTVADMALLEGGQTSGTGFSGGWGMIVIYQNSKMKWRDVTIFDGYYYVDAGNSSAGLELPVSGFNTVQSGNVGMKIGFMASEGDVGYTGDYFKIQKLASNTYTTLSRNANGVVPSPDNFFNSSITAPGTRNPNLVNNTGIDIGIVNIPNTNNSIIGNSQTATKFLYGTNGDTYSIYTIAMSVDAYIPEVEGVITATTINGSPAVQPYTILPGQEAGYSVDIKNIGTEAINNYKLIIPIPFNATYVAGSAAGTIFSPQTTPTPNNISFNPSLGATGSIVWDFGTLVLPANPSSLLARLTFKLKSTTDCAILSNATCGSNMGVVGNSTGIGNTTNVALNNSNLIQGYTVNGSCAGEPIATPINTAINGTSYVQQNCPNTDYTRHFSYCSTSTSVGTSEIASNFPVGSLFYNSFPVTVNSIQYTDANPIPLVAGSTVTYYAVPSGGGNGCNFPFTITKCPVIVAQNDTIAGGNGTTGNPNAGNVLNNNGNGSDTLNGVQATISQVNITVTTPATPIGGNPVPVIDTNTGQISVPPGTPAGTYTIVYNLCEKLNPTTNCDPATVTITVTKPIIDAVNDAGAPIVGASGGQSLANVLVNDTLNGAPASLASVNLTQVSTTNAGVTLNPANGSVNVAPGTPSGSYTVTYQICEKINPTNCDTATVTVSVTNAVIDAVNDAGTSIVGASGGQSLSNVLVNDTLNGAPATLALVNLTQVSTTNSGVTLNTANGSVNVAPGTPSGSYILTYQICEKLNTTNCDTATVTVSVTNAVIDAVNDIGTSIVGATGGQSFPYVLVNDTLNGGPANLGNINLTQVATTNPGVTLNPAIGSVNVAPGTPSGSYILTYQICEKLNPTNCDTATVTVLVTNAVIDAVNDNGSPINGLTGGQSLANVLVNDTLNGNPATLATINLTQVSTTNSGVTLNPVNGSVNVTPGTPAGSYTVTYQICEKLNPTNCDTATVSVSVSAAQIIANDDAGTPVNGLTGGTAFTNVLVNDTLNGVPVLASQVNTTFVSSTNPGITLSGTNVLVAPGTPAGSYTLVYQICEILNPTNCDTATVSVSVSAAQIIANDDAGTPINGLTGGTAFTNVLVNDTLNGVPVLASQVNTTFVSSTNPGITLSGTNVLVALGTPAGSYTLVYQICEILNPTNCDTATVSVSVSAAQIIANDDAGTPVNGLTGGTAFTNVLVNDTLNGVPVLASQVNTTFVSSTNPGITLSGTNVLVAPGTPAGSYTLVYQICEILNPTNCDTATVSVSVSAAQIIANDDAGTPVNGLTGGTAFTNVLVNDALNGVPVLASQVNTTFVSSTNPGITLSGTDVLVAPGTPAGSYTLVYQICEILNPTNCDTATVTVTVTHAQIIANDDAGTPVNGLTGGTAFTNVLVNDTLNGVPVLASQVNTTFVSSTNPGITLSGTDVLVAPGTPAGSYTLVYQICEILNPTNCDTATVTVTVTHAQIIANDDAGTPVNGLTGGTAFTNVLVNDTLNGVPVLASQVNTTFVSSTNPGITLSGTDVLVAPGTPAGSYTLVYQICEILNPTNCDTATVSVSVSAAQIIANDDAGTPVNGLTGGTAFTNVLVNDTLNGVPVLASQVNTTFVSSTNPGITLSGTDVLVAPGTPAGSYTLVYQICEILNPTNCDTATVSVAVGAAAIEAIDDNYLTVQCSSVGLIGNILTNDTLNSTVGLSTNEVNLTVLSGSYNNLNIDTTGNVNLTSIGSCGSYTFTYRICEILNPNNCDEATVTVVIQDLIAPTFTAPANTEIFTTADCTFDASVALTGDVTNEADNCSSDLQATFTDSVANGQCAGSKIITRTWTLVDACGNAAAPQTQTITVTDNIAPTFTTAATNIVVQCNGSGNTDELQAWLNSNGGAIASDNCSNVTWTNNFNAISNNCSAAVTVIFTATDACNNSSTSSATFTIHDTVAPTFTAPANTEIFTTADCTFDASVALTGDVTNEADNCSSDLQAIFTDSVTNGQCAGSKIITRTWTLVDACGNAAAPQTQTITVTDNIAPTFTAPANTEIFTTADCTFDASVALTGNVTNEADNCSSDLQATFTDSVANGQCAGSKIITRTWTLVDACGNAAAPQTQTITVTDNIAPTFTAPANTEIFTTADCTFDASVALTGDVTNEADNCSSDLQATFTDSVANGQCAGSKIITRTWTLVDACGNAAAPQTQTITVTDNIAPTFTAPANTEIFTTADCTFDASVALTGDVTNEADNCSSDLQATFTDSVANGQCAGSKIITRTWTLVDACGNAAAPQTQTITVTDNIAPTFTAPANTEIFTTADCTFDASVALTGDVTNEADNCSSDLQATFTDSVANGQCAGSKIITRTWTLVDACGNAAAPQTQTITVTDNIAPTFTAPANTEIFTTADCTFDASVALTGDVTNEADNCSSDLQATFTDSVANGQCAGSKIITRTWTLVDACGNAAAPQTQTITVTDNIAPTFTAPANTEIFTTADCTFDASVALTGDVTNEADNCSSDLQATFTDSVANGQCAGSKIITRTWTLVDACGNAAAPQTQTITVTDNIAPTFTTAATNIVVQCNGSGNTDELQAWLNSNGGAIASDNCSNVTWTNNFNAISNNCSAAVTVIFTATDACNNSSTSSATFTIHDTVAPTFTAPANTEIFTTADCTFDASVALTGDVTNEADNCSSDLQAIFTDSVTNGQCAGSKIITRTWTLVDACGNAAAPQTQTITVTDNIAPTFTAPANTEIFTTADCTFDASVALTGDVTNEADNCSSDLQATFTDSVANGQCAGSKIITRTWTLVDACGNAAAPQTQTITVTDNIAPTFTAPANTEIFTTADCTFDASVALTGDVTNEADNCSSDLQATFTDSVANGQCAGSKIITRTWTLVDACGNAAAPQTQTITVTDNIAPTFTAPANTEIFTTADCTFDASVALTGDVTNEADNCSSDLQATFTDSVTNGQCAGSKIITRTWTLVDACGNAAAPQTQTITVTDNIAPTFTAPANTEIFTTADCTFDASVALTGDVTNEADNCSSDLQATFTDSVANGQCAGSKIITRTWTLVDACGNAAAPQTQTITVTDNIAPTFTAPANTEIFTTADCTFDASVALTGDVTNEADNCSSDLQATFTDSVANGQCAGSKIITRTWTLVDACGNAAAPQTQTITVTDNIAPTFTAPANTEIFTTADCTFDASVALTGDVTNEADNCSSDLQATFTDSVANGQCAGSKIITRTWTLVDACGNAAAPQTQTITVTDNIAPTFTTAATNIVVQCNGSGNTDELQAWLNSNGGAIASDNCSNVTWTNNFNAISNNCSAAVTVIFTATDACNNSSTSSATFTIHDTVAPTFTAPANTEIFTTADCTFDASVALTGDVTNEADNCSSDLQAIFTDSVTNGQCAGSKIITRTWTLVDACGNAAAPQTQTITVTDNIAPTFTAPANTEIFTTADCTFDASVALTGDVTNEADNCSSDLQATFTDSVANGQCAGSKIITRTWTLVDACGNAAAPQTQTITVTDNIAPTFTAPANTEIFTTADCTFDASVALTGDVTNEADNCSSDLQATFTDSVANGQCAGSKIITRTWTLVDACGNAAAPQTQTITVTDNIAPTFTAPANTEIFTTADCTFDASVALTGDVTNEADNCSSDLQATFTDSVANGQCAGSKIITRTWTLVDACGNAAAPQTQTITVTDNIAPVAPAAPAPIFATCSGEVPAMISLTAMDNCTGAITVLGVDTTVPGLCPNSFTVTRKWTFVDACGNTSSTSQTISVNDTIPPTFDQSAPANVAASCDNIPAPAVITASDNCGTATVNMIQTVLQGSCPSNYKIIRTWVATDACGNENPIRLTQEIDVTDKTGPQLIPVIPVKIPATCNNIPSAPVLTASDFTDNCSAVEQPTFTQTQSQPINGVYTITWTWIVRDACGNETQIIRFVTVTQVADVTNINVTNEICNDQIGVTTDLATYLPTGTPTTGTWVNENNVGSLNGSVLNAEGVADGTYTFSYNIQTGTCPQKINIVVPIKECGVVLPCENIKIHNAITPNGDGLNEFFDIEHIEDFGCYPTNKVEIYNRWGVLVYEADNYDNSSKKFIGISEGRATVSKSQELPTGTYFYIVQWTTSDGQTVNKDGYLYLTR
ncbi:gliding motility-associated C-terminal domain-containing protein [Flavobacterium sp. N1994]|uniref:gliding motility-associated C-terminal domain-containing protein n=1 Tax=Flavobacterium sp. N1994 TaxID=2986827 RepID=UPI002223C6A5|nr:gliding motility-associated C-terminal domain-containing protein [Flavobacterium sp. N1994]